MRFLLLVAIGLISTVVFANTTTWNSQELNSVYKSNKKIVLHLDDKKFTLPAQTRFELVEVDDLSMIKVHLHKYKIDNCPSANLETDLELVSVPQNGSGKTSVGVNLSKGCKLEVFIDMKEYKTRSFLK